MTREDLERRWYEIASELSRITANKPAKDPAQGRVGELLAEQDRIEWEIGELDRLQNASSER